MIPAQKTAQDKRDLQKLRALRGKQWEKELLIMLDDMGWARRWPTDWSGQPFDIQACINGESYGIECKRIAKGNLAYSAFTPNEIENLSRHEDAGGLSVVAVYRDSPQIVSFIPWYAIRDNVLGGERGSIKLCEYPAVMNYVKEVPRP
ncbi:MAG: hypothetical protein RR827_03670 [Oscillospiraceae bacterium]